MAEFPFEPVAVTWEVIPDAGPGSSWVPGPTEYTMYAVVEFSAADTEQIVEKFEPLSGRGSLGLRPWFPEDLRAAMNPPDDAGVADAKGKLFDAKPFETNAHRAGFLLQIGESRRFFLVLGTS